MHADAPSLSLTAFLDVLPPLPLPAEMRAWDAAAERFGLSSAMLMENAGRVACDILRAHRPCLRNVPIWLFMGGGNNGGDAACLARHLADHGADVWLFHARPVEAYSGAAAVQLRMAQDNGVPLLPLHAFPLACAAALGADPHRDEGAVHACRAQPLPQSMPEILPEILVDGLLGTGFSGTLRPEMQECIERINTVHAAIPGCFVLALDTPSGLDAASGRPSPVAVRADATVSLAALKPGLALPEARIWTGSLHVGDIGIPRAVRSNAPCSAWLLDGRALQVLPAVAPESHKNTYGHVLVVGGAPGLSGAAHLACAAALRTGAGLVTAAAPARSLADIRSGWPEIMTHALDPGSASGERHWPDSLDQPLRDLLARATALVLGPGMGRDEETAAFLAALLGQAGRPPAVVDADALMALARGPDLLRLLTPADILTPHPGEAAALLSLDAAAVQADRAAALNALCRLSSAAVVLKGAGTLVSQAGAPTLVCPYDVPQLAIGGAGDVLAGCIGALRACREGARWPALRVAGLGVILHALAGRLCARRWPGRGALASDIADALPQVRSEFSTPAEPGPEVMTPWPA